MNPQKLLFIDRDGTIIVEPEDQQIDSFAKLQLVPGVIPALLQLRQAGFRFIMISNQDGLGTSSLPTDDFYPPHHLLLDILQSQGILFDAVHICPHVATAGCDCRKPKLGLVMPYLIAQNMDMQHSFVIGDRPSDLQLAENMGISGFTIDAKDPTSWENVVAKILHRERTAQMTRQTKETCIETSVNLDQKSMISINTGIGFFDHMLEQLAKHGDFSLSITAKGDLHIDEHHTVEDVALTVGQAIRQALGDKRGIARYGFLLPMDEALVEVALDLCGRAYFKFDGDFKRETVGGLATELIPHFFRSFSDSLGATLHIRVQGDNAHHMIEAIFKGVGRSLAQAINKSGDELPSTKGVL